MCLLAVLGAVALTVLAGVMVLDERADAAVGEDPSGETIVSDYVYEGLVFYSLGGLLRVEVTGYSEEPTGALSIPSTIVYEGREYDVVSIGDNAFNGCSGLTSIDIPQTVTEIGQSAFRDCESLESVIIPSGVTEIGMWAFYGCSLLTSASVLGPVSSIPSSLFRECTSLESVIIPDGVTAIGAYAFYNCGELSSVDIPDSVESVENYAFWNCKSLDALVLPESLKTVGNDAFYGCSEIDELMLPSGLESVADNAFYGMRYLTSLEIPASLTTIGNYAFGSSDIGELHFLGQEPPSVGSKCFSTHTVSYQEVHVVNVWTGGWSPYDVLDGKVGTNSELRWMNPTSAEEGEMFVHDGIWYMTLADGKAEVIAHPDATSSDGIYAGDIVVPSPVVLSENCSFDVVSVTDGAFAKSKVTSVVLGEGIESIGDGALEGCGLMKSITIPDTVTTIGSECFRMDYALTSITIPEGVSTIGDGTFYYCMDLQSVSFPSTLTSMGSDVFQNCPDGMTLDFASAVAPTTDADTFTIGGMNDATIYVSTPGWNPVDAFAGSHDDGTTIVWANPPYSDLEFTSDPIADGIYAYVGPKPLETN